MDLQLADKSFLVTGASSGIGQSTARVLAEEGGDVVVSYGRDADGAAETVERIAQLGRRAWPLAMDMADNDAVEQAIEQAKQHVDGLDGLVLCAGLCTVTPFDELSPEEFSHYLDVNLTGTFRVLRAARPMLRDGAAVVIVASVSGQTGAPHQAHYAAAKAGLINLTKSAARAMAPSIRVNCIAPGMTLTPMGAETATGLDPDYAQKKLLVGRFAEPDEIARCIVFLLSPTTGFMSGATLDINGGRLLR